MDHIWGYRCRECKVLVFSGFNRGPYEIEHHELCLTGIKIKQLALEEKSKNHGEWREIDYDIEPSWYWAESQSGAARGGRPMPG